MVKGLNIFHTWFKDFADQYLLIGGTATKDLDIVLHFEALTPAFGKTFWRFIEAGGYEIRQSGETGKPAFYRFQKPTGTSFPVIVELFSRAPDTLRPIETGKFTPIPFDEAVSSLSAILLDDNYYAFIIEGRRKIEGLSWVGEDRLIPLKAVAWLDLSARKERGEQVDARTIRKHANDVLRLSQLLAASTRIPLSGKIADDLRRFLQTAAADASLDPKALGFGRISLADVLGRVAYAYGLGDTEIRVSHSRLA
jgi:hypothetical protein